MNSAFVRDRINRLGEARDQKIELARQTYDAEVQEMIEDYTRMIETERKGMRDKYEQSVADAHQSHDKAVSIWEKRLNE